jgi:subtilisin family serine protease
MKRSQFFCFASVIILYLQSYAQINKIGNNKLINMNETQSSQVIETSIIKGDSVIYSYKLDLNEKIKLIVQFKEPSLALVKAAKRTMSIGEINSARSRIETEHSIFKSDLQKIEADVLARSQNVLTSAGNQIIFEYKTAINGMAITTKRWMAEEIKKLPYVKSVYEDKKVKAYDDQSNHVIGADSVWNNLGVTGKGIIIGMLDTGIDYMHPDLGGGKGAGFKVLGGYDFINNDNDPMDDHGHGTHTAGIAAAKGTLKGVAPDASLYAFKVLDQSGSGSYSVIIAGIERALDPDQNPNTNDAVDVISMSLGGEGNPDDIVCQAIDNATRAGILCVIAAGNNGSAYQTIGSPGCARTALTVGATDNNDMIADFSSRGPSNNIYEIKPDIVAPGVSINSTKMGVGGGYIVYSGTSMSTPHVAGCAALLLQLHPDWNPYVIKSALMQSAQSIGENPLIQGSGRVDIYKASKINTVTIPASFAFGLIDVNMPSFSKSDTLYVKNLDSSSVTYSVSAYGLPSGAALSFSENTISLQPYDSVRLIATLNVDNNTVADADPSTFSYFGHIVLGSPVDSMKVMFSFVKYPYVKVQFNSPLLMAGVLHNRSDIVKYANVLELTDNIITFFAPRGIYDIIGLSGIFERCLIVKENISVPSSSIVQLYFSEAGSTLNFNLVTQNNTPVNLSKSQSFISFQHKTSGLGIQHIALGFDFVWPVKYNNIAAEYICDWEAHSYRGFPEFYSYCGNLTDFSQSYTYSNVSTDFKHLNVHYNITDPPKNLCLMDFIGLSSDSAIYTPWWNFYLGYPQEDYLLPPFHQDWYLSPLPSGFPNKLEYTNFSQVYEGGPASYWSASNSRMYYVTPSITAIDKNIIINSPPGLPKYCNLSYGGSEMTFGLGPSHWGGSFVNSNMNIEFKSNGAIGEIWNHYPDGIREIFAPLFPSQFQDVSPKDLRYSLFRSGQLIESNNIMTCMRLITGKYDDYRFRIPVSLSGKYTLQIPDTNYSIRGRQGKALMKATFDLSKADKNPPTMHSLNVMENGEFTDYVETGQNASIQFSVTDDVGLNNVSLSYYSDSDTSHKSLSLVKNGDMYTSPIDSLPKGYISLRIIAEDNSGNILEYEVEPGFKFGINNPPSSFHLFRPADGDTIQLTLPQKAIKFIWDRSSNVDRDSLLYSLTLKGPNIDTVFASITDTSIVLNIMPQLSTASLYKWTVGVSDGSVSVASPDTFWFKTSDIISSVKEEINTIPTVFSLAQNYPNPFNPSTTIRFGLPIRSRVKLEVFNILGQKVATLMEGEKEAGFVETFWQANVASGLYIYRFEAISVNNSNKRFTDVKKMLLLR